MFSSICRKGKERNIEKKRNIPVCCLMFCQNEDYFFHVKNILRLCTREVKVYEPQLFKLNYFTVLFLDANYIAITVIAMFGKALMGMVFTLIYVSTGEIYPTVVRVTALGLGSSLARVGGALAPFVTLTVSSAYFSEISRLYSKDRA